MIDINAERVRFERRLAGMGYQFDRHGLDGYVDWETRMAWIVWLAAKRDATTNTRTQS